MDFRSIFFFDANWLVKAFYEVTVADTSKAQLDAELTRTRTMYMPSHTAPPRHGLKQLFQANCAMMATCAKNNVVVHFKARLLAYVKESLPGREQFERRYLFKLEALRVTEDLCEVSTTKSHRSSLYAAWTANTRRTLGLDVALGLEGKNPKPLAYQLKAHPERFLPVMLRLNEYREQNGKSMFALFPLRHSLVPRHVRFDKTSIKALTSIRNEAVGRKRRRAYEGDRTFANVLDYRAAGIKQRWKIKEGFTTDGVCARIQHTTAATSKEGFVDCPPRRGVWCINELRSISDVDDWHVIGVDPGKRELVVATDSDQPRNKPVRYTLRQRQFEMRTRALTDQATRTTPFDIRAAQEDLSEFSSRTPSLERFAAYCRARHENLERCLDHYATLDYRQRNWKSKIRAQASEQRLYDRIATLQNDGRPLCLAYGSWGAVAGRAGGINKGNPPCIGVGLMRKLSKRFVVALTPEHYTSKTCCRCGGPCGPHPTLRTRKGLEIRGLRLCQQEECNLVQNRDKTGSINIGKQFCRLMKKQPTLHQLTATELELQALSSCVECSIDS